MRDFDSRALILQVTNNPAAKRIFVPGEDLKIADATLVREIRRIEAQLETMRRARTKLRGK